jgi:hypothetical protein
VTAEGVEELLLALLRGERAPHAADPRWPQVLASARRHGVAPLLHETARELPTPVEKGLRKELSSSIMSSTKRQGGEARVVAALDGLRPVLLKGAALSRTIYQRPELRPRGDFDVLVAPDVAGEAARRLRALGYARHPARRGGVLDDPRRHQQTLVNALDPSVIVDLHRALCQPQRARLPIPELVSRARPIDGGPAGALALDPDDAILAHAVHLAGHELRVPLIHLVDLARLWSRCAPKVVVARARSYRVLRPLLCALWLLERCAEGRSELGGAQFDLEALGAVRRALLAREPALVQRALGWMIRRCDLARRPLGSIERLARRALLIDRMSDRLRAVIAHALARVRSALQGGPVDVLEWRNP